jgi:4-diphosphocytidyl-2-C-methyl-D-erythritol kinase
MITFPKAKINVGLRVTGDRPDGFHNIETIFYPVPLCDALEFVVLPVSAGDDELVATGLDIRIRQANNLVIKAVKRIRDIFPVPFLKIHLHKAIPPGAGLGGGSSDAVIILKAIIKYFDITVTESELKAFTLELGSDCPFFIDQCPSYATGRGEILKPVSPVLQGLHILLLNPGIRISTKEAYLNTHPSKPESSLEKLISHKPSQWKKLIINDFEDYACKIYPQIGELKKALYKSGAIYSSMSGSGSSVYGIYAEIPEIPEKVRKFVIYTGVL